MRILYIVPSSFTFDHGLKGQLEYLRRHQFEVEVASEDDARSRAAAAREGVTLWPVDIQSEMSPLRDLRAWRRLCLLFEQRHYDLISVTTKKGGMLAGLLAKRFGCKVVYQVRGFTKGKVGPLKRMLFWQIERQIARCVDRVLMISRSNLEEFAKRRICAPQKISLAAFGSSNGIDVSAFSKTPQMEANGGDLRRSLGIPETAFVAGFVGRLVEDKGVGDLFEAWQQLRCVFPEFHLLFATPPEVESSLESTVEALRRDRRVHFAGYIPDPRPVYAAMQCLILPSSGEGLGNAILEAGSMGVPSVAYRVLGAVDAIVDGDTGLLVEPHSPKNLARGIERLLRNREMAVLMGSRARDFVVKNFSQEVVWQALTSIFQKTLGLDAKGADA